MDADALGHEQLGRRRIARHRRGMAHRAPRRRCALGGGARHLRLQRSAGELLAARGWSLSDLTGGFGRQLREPDEYAEYYGGASPLRYKPYVELDHRPGWYGELAWHPARFGTLQVLRYDNRADASRSST